MEFVIIGGVTAVLHAVRGFDKPTKIFESKASVPVDPLWEEIANSLNQR
jgi:hypothetical protein